MVIASYMSENNKVDIETQMNEIINTVDFNKLGDTLGMPQLQMIESGKLMKLQLEYLMCLFESIFEMQSQFHISRFGDKNFESILLKYFPKGRAYFRNEIASLEKSIAESTKKIITNPLQAIKQEAVMEQK